MYQNDPLKVLTGECRFSYVHLDAPYANDPKQEPKYGVTLLIPKTDVATRAEIDQAMQAAIAEGISKTWNGQRPAMPALPIWDGDGVRKNGEPFGPECKGCWVITASTKTKPQVVHISNVRAELMPTDVYSGMYGRATIRFFTYSNSGNRGVGCGLGNVLKTREGEPLGAGRSSAEDDFSALEQAAPVQAYPSYPQQQYSPTNIPNYPQYTPAPVPGYPQYGPSASPVQPSYPAQGQVNPFTGQPM